MKTKIGREIQIRSDLVKLVFKRFIHQKVSYLQPRRNKVLTSALCDQRKSVNVYLTQTKTMEYKQKYTRTLQERQYCLLLQTKVLTTYGSLNMERPHGN